MGANASACLYEGIRRVRIEVEIAVVLKLVLVSDWNRCVLSGAGVVYFLAEDTACVKEVGVCFGFTTHFAQMPSCDLNTALRSPSTSTMSDCVRMSHTSLMAAKATWEMSPEYASAPCLNALARRQELTAGESIEYRMPMWMMI